MEDKLCDNEPLAAMYGRLHQVPAQQLSIPNCCS